MCSRPGHKGVVGILMAVLLFSAVTAGAAVMPSYDSLPSISIRSGSTQVSVGPDSKVYVAEGAYDRVSIFNATGSVIKRINVKGPTAVAANANGLIYIGVSNGAVAVRIFNASGVQVGELGAGDNEFKRAQAISIDAGTNNVYVVDSVDETINVYTEAGLLIRKINDTGNQPTGAVVYNNELYVLDSPPIVASDGTKTAGARIQVMTLEGTPTRSFMSYGQGDGKAIRPYGITVDAQGRLYVTDAYQQVVLCWDAATGTYLGVIKGTNGISTPLGIAMSPGGRLYVVSQSAYILRVFGIDNYIMMTVAPSSLSYSMIEGNPAPASQAITVSNSGKGDVVYTAAGSANWITLQGTTGTVVAGGAGSIQAGIDATGLTPGTYSGKVTVTDRTGEKAEVAVALSIQSSPKMRVSPTDFSFEYKAGGAVPAAQTANIEIYDDANGLGSWNAVSDSGWLSISPTTATGNTQTAASVTVNPAGLTAGTYTGKISFVTTNISGTVPTLNVTLTVEAAGSISVTTNLAEASFSISGPSNYNGTGMTWSVNNLAAGTYTITYGKVAGYKEPATETKTVSTGQTTAFSGNYTDLREAQNIVVVPNTGTDSTKAAVYNAAGSLLQKISLTTGSAIIVAGGDVDGDGVDEIIAGNNSATSTGRVTIYNRAGQMLAGADFLAYDTVGPVRIAAGDVDGDGRAEIIVGKGDADTSDAQVRIFKYEGGMIRDTGVNILVFTSKNGVTVASGDVDGDGVAEMIVAPGPDQSAGATVRVLKIDTAAGAGKWTAVDTGVTITAFTDKYGANVATGDLNGDGIAEIIVSSGSSKAVTKSRIAAFTGTGQTTGLSITTNTSGGLEVAAGDINMDGSAEIVVIPATQKAKNLTVTIYTNTGAAYSSFTGVSQNSHGARVALGNLGY